MAKVKETSSSYTRGIYDITTTVIVDAEPSFWVKNYGIRMKSNDAILDSSFIESGVMNTISLGF